MAQNRVDLVNIFSQITQSLAQNQQALDQADEYNHDHGSNMVQTFQTITNSLQQKQGKSASSALTYAAKKLVNNTTSGSGQLYAQGLSQAAIKLKGKQVDSKGALDLLQTLIGGGQSSAQSSGSDMLGALLGQLTGGASSQPSTASSQHDDALSALLGQLMGGSQPQPSGAPASGGDLLGALLGQSTGGDQPKPTSAAQEGGDILGSLLGGLTGGQSSSSTSGGGLDIGDLLNAATSFMQAKQQGGSATQALIQAFMAASGMGNSADRTQSTSLVVSSFLKALATSQKS